MAACTKPHFKAHTDVIIIIIIIMFWVQTAERRAFSEVLPCQKIRDTFKNFLFEIKCRSYTFTQLWWNARVSKKVNFLRHKEQILDFQTAGINHQNWSFHGPPKGELWNVHQWDKNKVFT